MSENEELTEEGLGKWLDRVFVYVPEHLFDMKPLDQLRKIVKGHFKRIQQKPTVTTDELCEFAHNWEGLSEFLKSRGVKVVEEDG